MKRKEEKYQIIKKSGINKKMRVLKTFIKILLPIIVLVVCALIAKKIIDNKKPARHRTFTPSITIVDAVRVKEENYRVMISTRGTVRPRTESELIPEVAGKVVEISDNLLEGEFFEEGDFLVQIDKRNYETEITIARAKVIKAREVLAEEKARVEQALRNWELLKAGTTPSYLVLRKPQLASAIASLDAAMAELRKKELDLERTTVTAPYSGRVLDKSVDVGQYVSPGSVLAKIYAVDFAEIRLPLSGRQLEFVNVRELYRGESARKKKKEGPRVTLIATVGSINHEWQGRVVRAEGAIDSKSRQSFVVAEVADPYGKRRAGKPPLKVGQFVEAKIWGHLLRGVIVIPRRALREGTEVMVAENSKLVVRKVNILWKDAESAVIDGGEGLKEGELLVLTPVTYSVSGTPVKVRVEGETPSEPESPAIRSPKHKRN
ncbi:MAG: efflux RND transporter periplasmic adaptor subunit [Thermodesulfobacteriota bacterium]